VSWIGRFGAAPDYTINAAFVARVEAVVKYALDANLYVIINLHHDGGEGVTGQWLRLVDGGGQVTTANTAAVLAQFKRLWTQIAAHFASYGDHLLFESMNEIKVGYDTPLSAYYDEVNALNQAFVDTVRAASGYNPNRCLVVPGYNTNIDFTVAGFVKPTDATSGKLILSDHYYDPWSFAGEASTHAWGTGNPGIDTWGQEDWVQGQVQKLKTKFIDQGLPMIWGEYGAVKQTGYEKYQRYYMEYVTKAVHDAGIVPFLWDNGSKGSGAEAFGLFDRGNASVLNPTLLEALVRAVTSSYTLADVAKP
jgi:endoglucanase